MIGYVFDNKIYWYLFMKNWWKNKVGFIGLDPYLNWLLNLKKTLFVTKFVVDDEAWVSRQLTGKSTEIDNQIIGFSIEMRKIQNQSLAISLVAFVLEVSFCYSALVSLFWWKKDQFKVFLTWHLIKSNKEKNVFCYGGGGQEGLNLYCYATHTASLGRIDVLNRP